MLDPRRISPFIDVAAVEAWDAWFRWRDDSGLRDFSIEDTWRRVATELASVESTEAPFWRARFLVALSTWRLLPDERILASAGTGKIPWHEGKLHASLNAASFVSIDGCDAAQIDLAAVADCAELAVHALDNAALLAGVSAPCLRVGLIGVADAMFLLGLSYDSDDGRSLAGALARALAEGCFRASIALACKRGAHGNELSATIVRAADRGLSKELLRAAAQYGLRHRSTTAITAQRRLALLANDVADALDPLQGDNHPCFIDAPGGRRTMHSAGYALNVLRARGCKNGKQNLMAISPPAAQGAMRAAVQPWMDEPISYPMAAHAPAGSSRHEIPY